MKRTGYPAKVEQAKRFKERFDALGTLQAVGSEFGVTRERVRQVLRWGEENGLFAYIPSNATLNPDILLREAENPQDDSIEMFCARVGITSRTMRNDYPEIHKRILERTLENRQARKRHETLALYNALAVKLGRNPTLSDMRPGNDLLRGRIVSNFGTFSNFVRDNNIEVGYRKKRKRYGTKKFPDAANAVLKAIRTGAETSRAIIDATGLPYYVVEQRLKQLERRNAINRQNHGRGGQQPRWRYLVIEQLTVPTRS